MFKNYKNILTIEFAFFLDLIKKLLKSQDFNFKHSYQWIQDIHQDKERLKIKRK